MQFTTDGTTWTDSGWSFTPSYAYDNSSTAGQTYTFTGSAVAIRGARVVGQVKTSGASSWYAVGREIKVFANNSSQSSGPSNFTIYDDALSSGWTDASYNTSVTATSSAYQGTTALAATMNAHGGLDFQSVAGMSTEGYTAVRFALRASQSGQQYEVYADAVYGEPLAAPVSLANYGGQPTTSEWKVYTVPLADLNATNITLKDIVIHDMTESNQPVLYVDSVELIAEEQPDQSFEGEITYDANGNMLAKGDQCYEYNEANQLSRVENCTSSQTIAEYTYDYKGQRIVKENYDSGTLASTVISWSNSFETKAIVGGATETTNYYFANNELVAKKDNSGNKVYFHNDHLGSNSITTNQAGAQVEQVTYDPWGQVLGAATQSKYLYTGQEHDGETGLNYYDARYYDSELRRFTQPDTIIQDIYNPQALNRYSYALNNPLKYIDPSGHLSILDYNNSLTQYYKKPSAITYNNVLNTAYAIQNQSKQSASKPSNSSSGGNGGGNGGGSEMRSKAPPGVDVEKNVREANRHSINLLNTSQLGIARNVYNTGWFYPKVTYKGDWDYKQVDPNNPDYQDFGNWHYGVVASAANIPAPVAKLAAGIAQQKHNLDRARQDPPLKQITTSPSAWFDAVDSSGFSRDQYMIDRGIIDYHFNRY